MERLKRLITEAQVGKIASIKELPNDIKRTMQLLALDIKEINQLRFNIEVILHREIGLSPKSIKTLARNKVFAGITTAGNNLRLLFKQPQEPD